MTGTLMVAAIPVAPTSNWNSGLFACFDDFGICLAGTFCLGFLDAHNNAKLSDRKMKFTDWLIGLGLCFCTYYMGIWCLDSALQVVGRGQIRARYNFPERAGDDFLATLLCCFCSSCQIARELKGRTTPPGIGGTGYGTAPPARNPSPYSGMA
jgi:Cys-rich protein (TIGR01571 family)